jgi:hypothetical protein
MWRTLLLVAIAILCVARTGWPQGSRAPATDANCPADSAKDTVQQLWDMAASGELVDRWGEGARLSSEPGPWPKDGSVRVVSDYWWVEYFKCSEESQAIVVVRSHWGEAPGVIDSQLRFTPPPPVAYQAGTGYRLIFTTPHIYTWGPNDKAIPGGLFPPTRWLIEGPAPSPFVTVTAAIRYVLEKRYESTDPEIRKNADLTLAKLLKMH